MQRNRLIAALSIGLTTLLCGCTSVNTLEPDFYTPSQIFQNKQDLKIGVLVRNPKNFEQTGKTTASTCVLKTESVYDAFVAELGTIFRDVRPYESMGKCTDCDAFAIYDSTLEFGVVHGCRIFMSAEFVSPKEEPISTVSIKKQAGFSQTHGAAIGLGALTGASLGLLAPITAPMGSQIACDRMKDRSEEVYAEVIAEMGERIRKDDKLSALSIKSKKFLIPKGTSVSGKDDSYTQLLRLKELMDKGILTQKEFEEQKTKILNK